MLCVDKVFKYNGVKYDLQQIMNAMNNFDLF